MTPAIYTIMTRFHLFRRTNADTKPDPIKSLYHSAHHQPPQLSPPEPNRRRIFDGIRNVMQIKHTGSCGSCK